MHVCGCMYVCMVVCWMDVLVWMGVSTTACVCVCVCTADVFRVASPHHDQCKDSKLTHLLNCKCRCFAVYVAFLCVCFVCRCTCVRARWWSDHVACCSVRRLGGDDKGLPQQQVYSKGAALSMLNSSCVCIIGAPLTQFAIDWATQAMCKRAKMCGWDDPGVVEFKTPWPEVDLWPRISFKPLEHNKDTIQKKLLALLKKVTSKLPPSNG